MGVLFLLNVLPFLHYANVFLLQKLKRCQTALFKTNALNQAQKEKWVPCIVAEMMSSEESDGDDDGDEESSVCGASSPMAE